MAHLFKKLKKKKKDELFKMYRTSGFILIELFDGLVGPDPDRGEGHLTLKASDKAVVQGPNVRQT